MVRIFVLCFVIYALVNPGRSISSKMDFGNEEITTVVANETKGDDEDVEVKHTIVVSTKLRNNNRRGLHGRGEGDSGVLTYNVGRSDKEDSGEVPVVAGYKSVETTQIRTPDSRHKAQIYPDAVFINRNIRDEYDVYPNVALTPSQWKPSNFYNNINWWQQQESGTVLTNAQIIDILQKEFNMDILYVHELEIDIYLNILKKFLKDWPQWDEFDSAINMLKNQRDWDKMKDMLETNYESLKAYLKKTLEGVEPLLKETIKEVKESMAKDEEVMEDDIVMQLQCTRPQLNQLFFRRPHPFFHHAIFNVDTVATKIRLSRFTLESMLNWPSIRININLNGSLIFRRDMLMTLSHVLVNKKLNYIKKPPELLKTNFQMRGTKISTTDTENFISAIDDISRVKYINEDMQLVIRAVCDLIKTDLESGPPYHVGLHRLDCPVTYRRVLSQYPFVRYLYSEVETSTSFSVNNYDLQLEETGIPEVQLNLSRFQRTNDISASGNFLKIECLFCEVKFENNILSKLLLHFQEFHQGEPCWQCSKCEERFSMEQLAGMKWTHLCEKP